MLRLFAVALVVGLTTIQATSDTPTLSELNRLKLQNISQRIELAQMRYQAAQREFATAREDLSKLMVSLKVDGYTLDLETLSYKKDPPK